MPEFDKLSDAELLVLIARYKAILKSERPETTVYAMISQHMAAARTEFSRRKWYT